MANSNKVETSVTFKVFNQDFNRAMSEMDSASAKTRKELQLQQEQLKASGTETQKLEAKLESLQKQQEIAGDKVKLASEQLDKAKATFGENSEEVAKLETKLLSLQIAEQKYSNQVQETQQKLSSYEKANRDLQTTLQLSGKSLNDFTDLLGQDLVKALNDGTGNSKQIEQAMNKIGKAAVVTDGDLTKLRTALRQVDDGASLEEVRKDLAEIGQQAEKTEQDMNELSDSIKNTALGTSAAIGGLGTGSAVAATQFDNAIGQIQAALGVTAEEAESLEDRAKNVWKAGFGESLEEVTDALVRVKQNMKGVTDEVELEKVTQDALALAKTFDSDVVEVTRAANNLMTNFGLSSEEAFDKMAKGAQNGLNFSNEMFDNLAEYAPLFADAGYSADEMFTLLEKGTEKGIYNLDYLNDVVKEFGIRLTDGSKGTADSLAVLFEPEGFETFIGNLATAGKQSEEFKELVKQVGAESATTMVEGLQKGGKTAEDTILAMQKTMGGYGEIVQGLQDGTISTSDAMEMIIGKLNEIEDPIERNMHGVQLFGTKWEDLGADVVLSLGGVKGALTDTEGAMKSVTDAQEQTFGQQWESFTRTAASSLEPLGKVLLDLAEQWLPKVISVVESVSNWFANLSPTLQLIGVAIGAVVAAIGPLIVGIGMIIPAITNIIGLFSKVSTGASLLGKAFTLLTGPVGITIGIITGLITAGVLLYQNWDTIKQKATELKDATVTKFNEIKDGVSNKISEVKTAVTIKVNEIKTETINKFVELKTGVVNKANEIYTGTKEKFDSIKTSILTAITGAKDTAVTKFVELKTGMVNKASEIYTEVKNKFESAKKAITDPIDSAKNTVSTTIESIKGFFSNLSLKIPDIKLPKLPKFKLTGEFSLNPPSVPKLSVSWNAQGGIFKKPTIFSTANAGMQGVGEAGPEAILPLKTSVLGTIGQMIANTMPSSNQTVVVNIEPLPIILDGKLIAEATFNPIGNMQHSSAKMVASMKGVVLK